MCMAMQLNSGMAVHEVSAEGRLKITLIKHHSCRVRVRQMGREGARQSV